MSAKQYPWCSKCGSLNHRSYDCSAPGTYTPTAADMASLAPPPAPESAAEPVKPAADEPAFDPPRWPGGPKICNRANLPAFDSNADLSTYLSSFAGQASKIIEGCACGCLHFEPHYPSPSGQSSGHERQPYSKRAGSFRRKPMRAAAFERQPDMPQREAVPEPAKKTLAPKPKPMLKLAHERGDLF